MEIIWTKHAEERQKEWEKILGVTRQEVENLASYPEQIIHGDMDALVTGSFCRNRREEKSLGCLLD